MRSHHPTLLLINPASTFRKGYLLRRESKQVPLGLGLVAALTPPGWKVKIWDENFRPFQYREADLVGITAMTATAFRAYEIASIYRKQGIPVVMGGIHATYMPDEALRYVDSVVMGEAEGSWPGVIADTLAGKLQTRYQAPLADMRMVPAARHDLFHPGYLFGSVQTSRGCPMDCDFCSVPAFNGNLYRLRETESILEEIDRIRNPMLYFVDDNIIGYNSKSEEHAIRLFEGMVRRGLKKEWFAQASLNIAENPELLKLAARSGCRMLLIGMEAENPEALAATNKRVNLRMGTSSYKQAFRTIHRAGINVLGAFIFGIETDTVQSVRKRCMYILNSPVDVTQASVMTPLPGTRLYDRIKSEGRIICQDFPSDWQRFHFTGVVFRPALMTPEELETARNKAYRKITRKMHLRWRFLRTWWNTRSFRSAVWAWNSNLNYREMAIEEIAQGNNK
jgi:radical SAM superfamily enzyme YgiQ (UPF0313 family)